MRRMDCSFESRRCCSAVTRPPAGKGSAQEPYINHLLEVARLGSSLGSRLSSESNSAHIARLILRVSSFWPEEFSNALFRSAVGVWSQKQRTAKVRAWLLRRCFTMPLRIKEVPSELIAREFRKDVADRFSANE
jgi:hypothetical protein